MTGRDPYEAMTLEQWRAATACAVSAARQGRSQPFSHDEMTSLLQRMRSGPVGAVRPSEDVCTECRCFGTCDDHRTGLIVVEESPDGSTRTRSDGALWLTCQGCGGHFTKALGKGRPPARCVDCRK